MILYCITNLQIKYNLLIFNFIEFERFWLPIKNRGHAPEMGMLRDNQAKKRMIFLRIESEYIQDNKNKLHKYDLLIIF